MRWETYPKCILELTCDMKIGKHVTQQGYKQGSYYYNSITKVLPVNGTQHQEYQNPDFVLELLQTPLLSIILNTNNVKLMSMMKNIHKDTKKTNKQQKCTTTEHRRNL